MKLIIRIYVFVFSHIAVFLLKYFRHCNYKIYSSRLFKNVNPIAVLGRAASVPAANTVFRAAVVGSNPTVVYINETDQLWLLRENTLCVFDFSLSLENFMRWWCSLLEVSTNDCSSKSVNFENVIVTLSMKFINIILLDIEIRECLTFFILYYITVYCNSRILFMQNEFYIYSECIRINCYISYYIASIITRKKRIKRISAYSMF